MGFIRKFYPDVIIIAGLGENQDTSEKRIDSARKGYLKGQPDILIVSPYSGYTGFAIELNIPKGWGLLSNTQKGVLTRLEAQKFKTLVSNDYDEVVRELCLYFEPDQVKQLKANNRAMGRKIIKLDER